MQGIEFQIVNDSAEASRGLDELAKSLKTLKSSLGSSGTQLNKVANGIRAIKNAINDVKLSSFESGMRRISDSLKPLGEMKFTSVTSFLKQLNNVSAENLEKIATIDFSNLKEAATDAKAISGVSRISDTVKNAKSGMPPLTDMGTVEIPAQTATMSEEYVRLKESAEQAMESVENVGTAAQKSFTPLKNLATHAGRLGNRLKELAKHMLQSTTAGKSFNSRLKDLVKSLGRIVKYRAIRSIIAGITSSLREGIQNLAQYSAALNNTDASQANKTMSEYASTLQQVKNSIGAAVMPALNSLLPIVNAIASAFMTAANAVNQFFSALRGQGTFTRAKKNAVDYAESLGGAAGAAKELKNAVMGFDELNVLPDQDSGGGGAGGVDYSDMFEEAEVNPAIANILEEFTDWLRVRMEEIRDIIASTDLTGADTWYEKLLLIFNNPELEDAIARLATDMANGLNRITASIDWNGIGKALGAGLDLALSFLVNFVYTYDWKGLGASIANFLNGAISEIDWQNVGRLMWAKFEIAIEFFAGLIENLDAAEVAHALSEFVVGLVDSITETIQNVDWEQIGVQIATLISEIDWVGILGSLWDALGSAISAVFDLADGFFETGAGTGAMTIIEALIGFSIVKKIASGGSKLLEIIPGATETVGEATAGLKTLSDSKVTMTEKLTDLAKNIGLGVLIVTEVAAVAIIFVGAIWVLGEELQKVVEAWKPVLENAATAAEAVGIGTGLLVAIGAACYGLGTLGGTAALNIGIGMAILAEMGAATLLFIAEVWAIGEGLQKVLESWQPVLNEGESVKSAIVTGTVLLVGVGLVTAALGAASVASYGLLPAAILIGVGVLKKLGAAFKQLVKQLTTVANELSKKLAPALDDANDILPSLKKDMSDFTEFMSEFAEEITDYTGSMGSITWDTIVGAFQKLFSKSPIKSFANSVEDIKEDTVYLQGKLTAANTELTTAVTLMTSYNALMEQLHTAMNGESNVNLPTQIFANMLEVGEQMILGLVDGIENMRPTYTQKIVEFKQILVKNFNEASTSACSAIQRIIDKLNAIPRNVTTTVNTISTQTTSSTKTKKYASGGFPTTGELFVAREAGAEMVGSIGGRTAVANNDQIVSAIKAGVYEAVASAMNNNKSDGGKQELHVYLDSKEISAGMNRRSRMYGAALAGT